MPAISISEVDYPEIGERLKLHGTPWRFSKTPARLGRAPKLGERNAEIFGALGYSDSDIASLAERKII